MEISPTLKLAIALDQKPRGVYALLLGSGLSSAAGIPTGWSITLDLIRRLSQADGTAVGLDEAEGWYRTKFKEEPQYDTLLDRLNSTPTERQRLIRSYIEPSDADREANPKTPTAAHRCIARLVKGGYIRMIVTTNFDRLIETALRDEGIEPEVISTDDALKGTTPFSHGGCFVIKVHGDYCDTRIRNTPSELEQYSGEMNLLLDRVFDEFGLIICGWSGAWDTALRSAIHRCPNRRFATYWLRRGSLNDDATGLIKQRHADVIEIESADQFFAELTDTVESLDDSLRPHPMSVATAIATVERYLPNPEHRIRLHNLVTDEASRLCDLFGSSDRFTMKVSWDRARVQKRLEDFEEAGACYWAMLASMSFHSNGEHRKLLTQAVDWLQPETVCSDFYQVMHYPSILSTYSVGVTAVYAGNFVNVAAVLVDPIFTDKHRKQEQPAVQYSNVAVGMSSIPQTLYRQLEPNSIHSELAYQGKFIDELRKCVHRLVRHVVRRDEDFNRAFEVFEFLFALTYMDKVEVDWSPLGSYYWKYFRRLMSLEPWDDCATSKYLTEHVKLGASSPIVQAGLCGGSSERFQELITAHVAFLRNQKTYVI